MARQHRIIQLEKEFVAKPRNRANTALRDNPLGGQLFYVQVGHVITLPSRAQAESVSLVVYHACHVSFYCMFSSVQLLHVAGATSHTSRRAQGIPQCEYVHGCEARRTALAVPPRPNSLA